MRIAVLIIFILIYSLPVYAQTSGGNSLFSFLRLPNAPQLTALGGINISAMSGDIGLSFHNPALLRKEMHTQLSTVFTSMYAGIKNYHVMLGYHHEKLITSFSGGIQYLDYGTIPQTDAAGNVLGSFRPGDYVIQASFSRRQERKWHYGGTLKFIHSGYGLYRSSGIAMDAGVSFFDSLRLFQASLVLKNMGTQLRRYEGTAGDDLPFDIQVGITKRLSRAPIQFSLTAHHLHTFDIRYNDTSFSDPGEERGGKFIADKIFRHFIVATQFFIEEKVEISAAYNHLRRSELNISNTSNGLNGFSMGLGVLFKKMQVRYARTYYQNNTAYNQFGLNLKLNELTGLGNFGQRSGW